MPEAGEFVKAGRAARQGVRCAPPCHSYPCNPTRTVQAMLEAGEFVGAARAAGRVMSSPKRMSPSQVSGGFWSNLEAGWWVMCARTRGVLGAKSLGCAMS